MGSLDVTTLANVKTAGFIDDLASATYDAWIDGAIDEVSSAFETYLGRDFLESSRTEVFDVGVHQVDFWLRHFPITSITSVTKRRHLGLSFVDDGIVVDADQYDFDFETGLLSIRPQQQTVAGRRVLEVIYVGGFGTDQADLEANYPDIVNAANRQIAWMFKRRKEPGNFSQSIAGQATKVDMEVQLLKTVKETLGKYRAFSV